MDGSKAVLKGKPTSISCDTLTKPHKVHRGPTKRIAWDHGRLPSSKNEILELLHDFVNQFLSGGYNVLMQSLREDIDKEHHSIQQSDVIVFFQVAQFVTSFQYYKFLSSKPNIGADTSEVNDDKHSDDTHFGGDICGPIAESMNESMFQLVFSHWRNTFEGLKETQNFKFLSAAGSLMKNMICMLDLVLTVLPEDSKESQTARILLYKLFYDQTDQGLTQFLLNLLKSFDTHKQAKSDLEDLVEMICKILQLMENLQARGTLRVSRKHRKARKKKAMSDKETKTKIAGETSALQNENGVSNSEQQAEVNRDKEIENTSVDGQQEMITPVHSNKCEGSALETDSIGVSLPEMDDKNSGHANDDLYGTDDSSGDEQVAVTDEVDFKASAFVSSLANHNIIQKLCWLLKFYKSNAASTNDYIIRMLRKISEDLELSPMLYQLSLLKIFYDILFEQKSCSSKEYANIVDFLTSLIRKMLKKMKNQPLLFVEALFWKVRKECHHIDAEYLLHELGHFKKESKNWGKKLGNVDIGSSQHKEWTGISIADALGEDEADVVITHDLGNNSEEDISEIKGSTQSILDGGFHGREKVHNGKKPVELESEGVAKIKKRIVLESELDEKIRSLYEKFKDSQDCSRLIAEDLDYNGKISPFQVSKKLKQLGLMRASRKRLRHADGPSSLDPNELDRDENGAVRVGTLGDSNDLEHSLLNRPTNARKRVRAFSEDQEATIRTLYEQFKDHKRCSYMIANALDADNKFTASQVSRKLKQLGLYVPRQKKSQTSKHLKDDDLNEFSTDKVNDSDDETLLSSLVNKRKNRENSGLFSEDAAVKNADGKLSKDESDDDLIASLLKKKKVPLSSSDDVNLAGISIKGAASEDGLANEAQEGIEERSASQQSGMVEPSGPNEAVVSDTLSLGNSHDTREAEEKTSGSRNPLHVVHVNSLNHEVDDNDNDLEDSEDEVDYSEFSISVVNRRRMVLDVEDDD